MIKNDLIQTRSIQTSLTVPISLYLKLYAAAENQGQSMSAVVRNALIEYFHKTTPGAHGAEYEKRTQP